MTEHRRQSEFLRGLLDYDRSAEKQALLDRLNVAERNERCLASACRSVALIGVVGLSGLGYAAVLLPGFFDRSSHFLVQFFSALGLGSLMCFVLFVGIWLWYRAAANRVREDCRQAVLRYLDSQLRPEECHGSPVIGQAPYVALLRHQTGQGEQARKELRKAS
jgi:hypothetical protein